MSCIKCGGDVVGDGFTSVHHCENANETDYEYAAPDEGPFYCDFVEPCDKCQDDHVVMVGCCSGRNCGCMGQPVDAVDCDKCNTDGTKPPAPELVKRWPFFFDPNWDK